jgi:multidrug efflux pump subunit AcrA (membrane-fusion protein)
VLLDQANDNYANRQLVVPFDNATVAEKMIEPGERKQAHEVAFRLIDISTVHVTFGVPDTMVGERPVDVSAVDRIHLGQELQLTAEAFEGRTFTGTVTKIAPQSDPRTRTFTIELSLPNPLRPDGDRLLRPGMIVTVRIGSQNDRRVLLLPLFAIHRGTTGELFVYEAATEDGREVARMRKVALGGVHNNQVEILAQGSEVQPGSKVGVTTAERLADGLAVRAIQDPSAATLPEAR